VTVLEDSDVLEVEVADGLATITLNRPSALNALNMDLKVALASWLDSVRYDDAVRAVLITGAGRAFCAGGDLSEMDPNRTPQQARMRQDHLLREVFLPLAQLPKPVVAAVNGHAHGAGLSLALACDIVIAAEDAAMSLGYVHRGLVPDCGVLYFLPRIVGTARAKELLLTGRRFDAREAQQMGLISQAVPADELLATAGDTARALAAGATVALGMTKTLVDQSWGLTLEQVSELESFSQAVSRSTADHREGLVAFQEKRPAVFRGA
jgi:2-(1,2-epoxy-1,2-dihydrophenyl)acetyl-CoA isomerase